MKRRLLWILALACCLAILGSSTAFGAPKKIAWVPSVIGIPFFALESEGFKEACKDFGYDLIYLGPEKGTPEEETEIINNLIIQKVDGIDLVPTDPEALNTISKKAMDAGIKMIENGSRNMKGNVNISTIIFNPDDVGKILMDMGGNLVKFQGEFAILSAAATSTAQNEWIAGIKKEFANSRYSKMRLVTTAYGDDQREKSYNETVGLLRSYPNLKLIISPTSVGIAAAAAAVTDAAAVGKVVVTGLGLPSELSAYIKNGACPIAALWSPIDLGYFNAYVMHNLFTGKITGKAGEKFKAGRLGDYTIAEDGIVIYQRIFKFDKSNIADWETRL
jgi:rhamnose transport system substrate-binding protein